MNSLPLSGSRSISSRSGFTLVELLTVIAIIAILAGAVLAAAGPALAAAKRAKAANTASQLQAAILSYNTEYGVYPLVIANTQNFTSANTDLIYALCGNINPANGTATGVTTFNTRNIAYLSPTKSDLDTNGAIKTPFKDPAGPAVEYFNIAMDNDYDNILTGVPDFSKNPVGANVTNVAAGAAVWSNCDQKIGQDVPSKWVHTY